MVSHLRSTGTGSSIRITNWHYHPDVRPQRKSLIFSLHVQCGNFTGERFVLPYTCLCLQTSVSTPPPPPSLFGPRVGF